MKNRIFHFPDPTAEIDDLQDAADHDNASIQHQQHCDSATTRLAPALAPSRIRRHAGAAVAAAAAALEAGGAGMR